MLLPYGISILLISFFLDVSMILDASDFNSQGNAPIVMFMRSLRGNLATPILVGFLLMPLLLLFTFYMLYERTKKDMTVLAVMSKRKEFRMVNAFLFFFLSPSVFVLMGLILSLSVAGVLALAFAGDLTMRIRTDVIVFNLVNLFSAIVLSYLFFYRQFKGKRLIRKIRSFMQ